MVICQGVVVAVVAPIRKSKNITLDDVKRRLSEYEYDA